MGSRLLAALVAMLAIPSAGAAQDVTLTARDGSLSVDGTLRAYDGEVYRIDSAFGPLTLDGQAVVCTGPGCPDLTAPFTEIRIVGAADPGAVLIGPLVRAFAAAQGLEVAAEGEALALSSPADGRAVGRIGFRAMPPAAARAALAAGEADLALASRAEPDFGERTVALDAMVPVTAPGNPLPRIATPDLARVLAGEVANWSAIGGPDMPLVLHGLDPGTGLQEALAARLGATATATVRHPDAAALARAVAADPYALAVTAASAAGPARVLPLTDSCGFPLDPGRAALKAGDYPLALPVFLLTPRRRLPLLARDFVDFTRSPSAQAAVAAAGLADRAAERAPLTADGTRLLSALRGAGEETTLRDLQRLAAAMTGSDRLSLTFRFEDGSATLDAPSQDNLSDLARLYAAGAFRGQALVLAGFSDGTGSAAGNLALSRARAEGVAAALAQAATDLPADAAPPVVEAFGETLPMACDTTTGGRRLNRRVEVWLRPAPAGPSAATDTP
mgnify:CR=1 FL=1